MTDHRSPIETPRSDYWQLAKPDWPQWTRFRVLPLWQAVSLACDLAPSNLETFGPNADLPLGLLASLPSAFKECLDLARSAVASGTLRVVPAPGKEMSYAEVEMAHFASWLRTIRHQVPESFPWTPEALRPVGHQWPWGSHSTKGLNLLAQAADRFWKNHDPRDISTAPKNQDVIDWLVSQGMSKRTSEVVASLLRPDELPTGPR